MLSNLKVEMKLSKATYINEIKEERLLSGADLK